MKVLMRLWNDEAGVVVSSELILIATITVIGMVVGLSTLRDSVTNELADVAGAIDDVNQSYATEGIQGHSSAVSGFNFLDNTDYCDDENDATVDNADQCVVVASAAIQSILPEVTAVLSGSDIAN